MDDFLKQQISEYKKVFVTEYHIESMHYALEPVRVESNELGIRYICFCAVVCHIYDVIDNIRKICSLSKEIERKFPKPIRNNYKGICSAKCQILINPKMAYLNPLIKKKFLPCSNVQEQMVSLDGVDEWVSGWLAEMNSLITDFNKKYGDKKDVIMVAPVKFKKYETQEYVDFWAMHEFMRRIGMGIKPVYDLAKIQQEIDLLSVKKR